MEWACVLFKSCLEHRSSKTTETYTHVSKKSIGKIVNPLNQALKEKYEQNNFRQWNIS